MIELTGVVGTNNVTASVVCCCQDHSASSLLLCECFHALCLYH